MALVFALVKGNDYGWGSQRTIGWFALAAVLLVAFLQVQTVSSAPLVPTKLLRLRNVLGADAGALLIGAGIFAIFFFMILWMQQVNGWSPIRAGVAFLCMPVSIGISAGVSSRLLTKVGPRPLLLVGPITAGIGLLSLGLRLEPDSTYLGTVLPSLVCVALGMGMTFVSLTSAAVAGVAHEDAGMASAMLNAGQQVGGALGLAILTAVSTSRTDARFPGGSQAAQGLVQANAIPKQVPAAALDRAAHALVEGWGVGFIVGAGLIGTAVIVLRALIHVSKEEATEALKEAMAAG
jgi:predicted MFS family arabinose efflux permease